MLTRPTHDLHIPKKTKLAAVALFGITLALTDLYQDSNAGKIAFLLLLSGYGLNKASHLISKNPFSFLKAKQKKDEAPNPLPAHSNLVHPVEEVFKGEFKQEEPRYRIRYRY